MNDKAKFVIKTQAESVTIKQLLIITVIAAAVIAFLCLFLSIPITIGVVKTNIVVEPDTDAGQMKLLGIVYVITWALFYGGFMLKFFWNYQQARRGIENCDAEGEYCFYDDHLEATLNGERRRVRYSEMQQVDNRDNEAFAFVSTNPIQTGTDEIAFGLNKMEIKFKKGENYWMHIRTLISADNPSCEFNNVVKGTKSVDKKKKYSDGRKKGKYSAGTPNKIGTAVKVIFLFVGAGFIFGGFLLYQMGTETLKWPTANGKITSSALGGGRSSRGPSTSSSHSASYGANILYEFSVKGQKYFGVRVSYGDSSSSFKGHGQDVVDRYPVDRTVTVHYNPKNPKIAVLETGAPLIAYVVMGIGGFIALISLLLILFKRKSKNQMKNSGSLRSEQLL